MNTRTLTLAASICLVFVTAQRAHSQESPSPKATQEAQAVSTATTSAANDDAASLAKKLSNPIAALISVPFQFNWDSNLGPNDDGDKFYLNTQPVIPVSISQDWNMISRTIVPLVYTTDLAPGVDDKFGLGDILQSLFFSPKAPGPGGIIWGLGPVALVPTATDDSLGGEKWGAGPTGVALMQKGRWTIGALANHIWSFAGNEDRDEINATFLQPFLSYTTPKAWTMTLNTESTYDWNSENWSVPVNAQVSKLFKIGKQPVSLGGGLRYWAESPDGGPEGLGARVVFTLLFPKKK